MWFKAPLLLAFSHGCEVALVLAQELGVGHQGGVARGGGFVLGIVPVLLLGRGSGGLLLMAVVLFFLAYHRARVKKYDRRNTVLNRDLEAQTDLVVLAIALVIVNLVFLRISQYAPGIAIFIASLRLIGVPHKFLSKALGAYFVSSFAILRKTLKQLIVNIDRICFTGCLDDEEGDDDDATYSKNFFSTKTNRFGIC